MTLGPLHNALPHTSWMGKLTLSKLITWHTTEGGGGGGGGGGGIPTR